MPILRIELLRMVDDENMKIDAGHLCTYNSWKEAGLISRA